MTAATRTEGAAQLAATRSGCPRIGGDRSSKGDVILEVRDLSVKFWVNGEWFTAAEHMNYDLKAGEVLAIVGESGSGKTQSSMSLIGLLPTNGRATGSAKLKGIELVGLTGQQLREVRGNEISVIFQEPMTALNPVYTVGFQIVETLRTHFVMAPAAGEGAGDRADAAGRDPRSRGQLRQVPAPALRRPAAAHHDRPGAGLRPEAADRRRADDGARRDRAGRDPQADARAARAGRRGHHPDHPRHGCGGRHGRPHRRDEGRTVVEHGTADEIFNRPQHPYTQAAAGRRAAPGLADRRRRRHHGAPQSLVEPTGRPAAADAAATRR